MSNETHRGHAPNGHRAVVLTSTERGGVGRAAAFDPALGVCMSRPLAQLFARASRRLLVVVGGGGKTLLFGEADGGTRTRDPRLGKPMLYQLSYVRVREER
jgi:hypothetical protein